MRFIVTSGTNLHEYVDQREGAEATLKHVLFLIQYRLPNIRIFDEDGRELTLNDLRRRQLQESQTKSAR
jgi:hypothetical protein